MKKVFAFIISGGILLTLRSVVSGQVIIPRQVADSINLPTIYNISLQTLEGGKLDLLSFQGKKILIVNTASECGYTYQYEGLQKLSDSFGDKLVIIGCPCNQFGNQEPGDSAQIREFCTKKFSVTFPMSAKLDVKGSQQHALYKWLCNKSENGVLDATVKWNFNKFLIDENGHLMAYFGSKVKPDDVELLRLIRRSN